MSNHELAAGAKCTDDGTGVCAGCGVHLTVCDLCHGIGYHAALCPDSDETIMLAILRDELAHVLERQDLIAYRDALLRCDEELLAALRSLGLAGQDTLTDSEAQQVIDVIRPALRHVAATRYEVGP